MYLLNPIISNFHRHFEHFLKFFNIFFFDTPIQIVFSEIEGKVRRRLLIDSTEKSIKFFFTLRCQVLRRIVKTKILNNPLIIVRKRKVISRIILILVKENTFYLVTHLFGVVIELCFISKLLKIRREKSVVTFHFWLK